jgi:hypothetical protein
MSRAKPAQERRSSTLTIKHLAAEVRPISKAALAFPVDQADLVDTKDLAAQANGRAKVTPISKAVPVSRVGPADVVNTKDPSVLVDLAAQANGRAKVTPISKAVPVSRVGPADMVNTKDPSVLVDLAAQANGRAQVTPISKAVPVHPAVLGATKVRANQPSAAKTRICLSASKSIRHADDETGIADYLRAQNAGSLCRLLGSVIAPARGLPDERRQQQGMSAYGT